MLCEMVVVMVTVYGGERKVANEARTPDTREVAEERMNGARPIRCFGSGGGSRRMSNDGWRTSGRSECGVTLEMYRVKGLRGSSLIYRYGMDTAWGCECAGAARYMKRGTDVCEWADVV